MMPQNRSNLKVGGSVDSGGPKPTQFQRMINKIDENKKIIKIKKRRINKVRPDKNVIFEGKM